METFILDPKTNTTASVPRFVRQFQRRQYKDKHFQGGEAEWKKKLAESTTVYVGNLSCYTNEYQLYELFTRCGSIKRIIMGLDKNKKTPCGFCFVEFDDRESAMKSVNYLNRTHLDGREVQIDIDGGFQEGRQYGRGASGGQVADERRRERSQAEGGPQQQWGGRGGPGGAAGGGGGGSPILTRSITIVACLAMISALLIVQEPCLVTADVVLKPNKLSNRAYKTQYISQVLNPLVVRKAQISDNRVEYEKAFAQFLVNIMKAAKPTLMKAFIQATLADKQLKEIAIGIFFNNTSSEEE